MTQYWCRKVSKNGIVGLVPTTAETEEKIRALNNNTPARVEIKQPRNGAHHRLYWAICAEIAANTEGYKDSTHTHRATLYELGKFDIEVIVTPSGKQVAETKWHSISYAEKDQAEFAKYYEQAKDVWAMWGYDPDELERRNA